MKEEVIGKIGAIGVFFFLTTLWNKLYFPGPYKTVEKGIALLHYLVSGESMESMSGFLPRSSLYEIYKTFFKTEKRNFCFPTRKQRGQALDEHEAIFNTQFAGFRSMIEATFGDLGRTFRKFNNKNPIRTTSKKEVNMMLRLCFLPMNVRNMSNALNLEVQPHHMAWTEDGFDYPRKQAVLVQSQVATV
ncbi:hypothetical protein K457DRAFT_77269 [Linnemannia elongata AG-77]|uniref:DDE Tnp4 domain-containing protein n=1 Tax=Linnemannia elongata AG-77 TaxID=1314771 RepID=A0A197JRL2_9FUNG|nr:hypothetical protein K457DRAFT_77269 [Linnemannia elongata AG-77]